MMFTRAQVRKQKSNGSSGSGGSNQRSKPSRSQQQKQQEQQQYAYDNRYKPSNYPGGSSNSSVVGMGTSTCSNNNNNSAVRLRERDRDRDCNTSTTDRSSGYYSDPYSSSASIVPHHSRYSSYELPRQHSKEDSYSPHRPYLERNATYVVDHRTRPRSITNRRGAIKHQKTHEINGHRFVAKFFRQPTFCAFCNLFLWGGQLLRLVVKM